MQDLVARVTKMESSAKQTESAQTVALNKKVNQMEKILKRNNAVISSLEVDEGVSLFEGVTRFLKIKFGLNNCVEEVRWLSKKPAKILVKFNDASAKRNMLRIERNSQERIYMLITTERRKKDKSLITYVQR